MRQGLSVFSRSPEQAKDSCAEDEPLDFSGQQQRSATIFPEQRSARPFPVQNSAKPCPERRTAKLFPEQKTPDSFQPKRTPGFFLPERTPGSFQPEGMAGSVPVAASCSSGGAETDLETSVGSCSTDQSSMHADQSDWSAPSLSRFLWDAEEATPDADGIPTTTKGMMHGKGRLGGLGDVPDMRGLSDMGGLQFAAGDADVAAPDWLDVTTAMLSAIDDPDPVSM